MNAAKTNKKVKKDTSLFKKSLLSFLNGTFLTRDKVLQHMPFVLFLVLLAVGYISYGYHAESTVKRMYELERQVKELKAQDLTLKSDLEQIKQQSNVAEVIKEMGLQDNRIQPFKISRNTQP